MKLEDLVSVIEGLFTRSERIGLWLLSGVSIGMMKAGGWILEGVPRNVALVFGAFYTLHALILVWMIYVITTRALPVGLRLWRCRR